MADYIVTSGELTTVADAIREKNGTSGNLSWPNGFVEGISSSGGSWQTVFEGSVTTELDASGRGVAILEGISSLTADTIKVTFNGVEYTLNRYTPEDAPEGVNAYGDLNEGFLITSYNGQVLLRVPSSGTYTLKIEEPQSGGSSDFSTAEVIVINTTSNSVTASAVSVMDTPVSAIVPFNSIGGNSNRSYIVPLYKGLCSWEITSGDVSVSVSGNISYEDGYVDITGDCTITIS